jgi:hypothetical protein
MITERSEISHASLRKPCNLVYHRFQTRSDLEKYVSLSVPQCWTKGRSSTAVAEDSRPMATAAMAEV